MSDPVGTPLWQRVTLATIASAAAVAVLWAIWQTAPWEPPSERIQQDRIYARKLEDHRNTPMIVQGIATPGVLGADEVHLSDHEEVIGVEAEGQARAYLLRAFLSIKSHVVNDLVGKMPITVTYCDRCDTVQVVTSTQRGRPLAIHIGGFLDDNLLLYYGQRFLKQSTLEPLDQLPAPDDLRPYPWVRTSWKDWRIRHPDTKVYVGIKE